MKYPAREVLPVVGILLVALLLRYYHHAHEPTIPEQVARLSYDPALRASLGAADRAIPGTYPAIAGQAYRHLGGWSGVLLLSLAAGTGTVLLVYWVGRELFDHRRAWIAMLLAAASPHLVYQSQLATSQAVTTFLAVLVLAFHLRSVATEHWPWRVAYLVAFGLLAAADFSGFLRSGTSATGAMPTWGPAALVLIGIVAADLLRYREYPIPWQRVAAGYLLPVILLSPSFSYTLDTELSVVPDRYLDADSDITEHLFVYTPTVGEMGNVYAHHLLGHGLLRLGKHDLGNEMRTLVFVLYLLFLLVAAGVSVRARGRGEGRMALRVKFERGDWAGLKLLIAFVFVVPPFAYLLQWYIFPRPVDFHVLVGASGCAFLIFPAAGMARLGRRRWVLFLLVAPLAGMMLFALRKSYQLFG